VTVTTTFNGYGAITQMFLSRNLIATLDGVQHFANLRVLSIARIQIAKINELRFLDGLPLQNLHMEGNLIAGLACYKCHVLAVVPTLVQLDGSIVKERTAPSPSPRSRSTPRN
jgi:hypothetical protein